MDSNGILASCALKKTQITPQSLSLLVDLAQSHERCILGVDKNHGLVRRLRVEEEISEDSPTATVGSIPEHRVVYFNFNLLQRQACSFYSSVMQTLFSRVS